MYVVLGASGNTGRVVATTLLERGHKVRVVGRNAAHLQPFTAKGAEAFPSDLTNAEGLKRAFAGAQAAYVLVPPAPASNDYRAFQNRVSDAIASSVKSAGVKHVVFLSSIGADKPNGTGLVEGLRYLEEKLNRLEGTNVLNLRAGYFMENTLSQVGAIRALGSAAGPLRPDLKLQMIAAKDIGTMAADALLRLDFKDKQTHELHGQRDLDYTEMARIIGEAIGKPDLGYIQLTDDQAREALLQFGMMRNLADLLLEMTDNLNSGYMKALEPRFARNTTPTSYETFVAEQFVPLYQQQAAA